MVDLLSQSFPDVPWMQQMSDMIEGAVDRALRTFLQQPAPATNNGPIGSAADYRMPARTADQIKADIAAHEGSTAPAPRDRRVIAQANAAYEGGDRDGFADISQPDDPLAQPKQIIIPKQSDNGWAL